MSAAVGLRKPACPVCASYLVAAIPSYTLRGCPGSGASWVRTGVIGDKRTGVMGYSSGHYVLEACDPMDEMIRFVMLAQNARFTVSELCEQFGISRKTGYKHLERYAADGLKGLAVRSHRPHQFPQRTDSAVEAWILAERRLHRTWGPKKLHKVLEVKHGLESPPARSTIGEILRRHGLSVQRRCGPGTASRPASNRMRAA